MAMKIIRVPIPTWAALFLVKLALEIIVTSQCKRELQ
jgi:hypothetical protein